MPHWSNLFGRVAFFWNKVGGALFSDTEGEAHLFDALLTHILINAIKGLFS